MPGVVVDPAPWIAQLPRDQRGFLIPAETPWEAGQPRLTLVGTEWKVAQAFLRACAVCGRALVAGRPVYRAFSQGDAAQIRGYEREFSNDLSGPAHLSCMLYSAITCPYLREPTSRLGKQILINPGKTRGRMASVMGFSDAVLLLFGGGRYFLSPDDPQPYFAYRTLVDDLRFRSGEDLVDAYAAAVDDDAPHISTGGDPAIYLDGADPVLNSTLRRGHAVLRGREPDFRTLLFGNLYVGYEMPVLPLP